MRVSILLSLLAVGHFSACAAPRPTQAPEEPARPPAHEAPADAGSAGPGAMRAHAPESAGVDAGPDARVTRPDGDIVRDIERTIHANGVLMAQGAAVRVTCDKGEVTLRGTVKDEGARNAVTSIVRQTPGVHVIHDLLKPIDPHPSDMEPGPTGY